MRSFRQRTEHCVSAPPSKQRFEDIREGWRAPFAECMNERTAPTPSKPFTSYAAIFMQRNFGDVEG